MSARDLTLMYLPEGPEEVRISAFIETVGAGDPTGFTGWHLVEAGQCTAGVNDLLRAASRDDGDGNLVAHGRRLFDLLLPEPVAALLRVDSPGRLRVIASEAARAVPWPLLHDGLGFLGTRWALGELLATGRARRCRAPALADGAGLLVIADPAGNTPEQRARGQALVERLSADASEPDTELRAGPLTRADFSALWRTRRSLHVVGRVEPESADAAAGLALADGRFGAAEIHALGDAPSLICLDASGPTAALWTLAEACLLAGAAHVLTPLLEAPAVPLSVLLRLHAGFSEGRPVGECLRAAQAGRPAGLRLRGDPTTRYADAPRSALSAVARQGLVLAVRRCTAPAPRPDFAEAWLAAQAKLDALAVHFGAAPRGASGPVSRFVFGLGRSFEDDASRAARLALALGAHLGDDGVVVLAAGRLSERAGEVVGQAVWGAESAAWALPPGVYVLPEAAERLGAGVALGPVGAFGSTEARALRGLATPATSPALLGRDAELGLLSACAARARTTRRFVSASVLGSMGLGRTALLQAVAARLAPEWRILRTAGAPSGEGEPLAVVAALLADLAGAPIGAPTAQVSAAVRALLRRLDEVASGRAEGRTHGPAQVPTIDALLAQPVPPGELSRHALLFDAVLGVSAAGPDARAPERPPSALAVALREVIAALANQSPVAWLIDDLQWLAPEVEGLIDELEHGLQEGAVFVLATQRPESTQRDAAWRKAPGHVRVDLGPLSDDVARALLRASNPEAAGEHAEALLARAEGNPAFLFELAQVSRPVGGATPGVGPLPASVEACIQARLDALPPRTRTTLAAASLLGREFSGAGLSALLVDEDGLSSGLAELEAARLLLPRPTNDGAHRGEWRFAHGLLHEAVQSAIPGRLGQIWHRRAARWLEAQAAARPEVLARVARHRTGAGDHAAAASAWLDYADHARRRVSPDEHARALRAALESDAAAGNTRPAAERVQVQCALAEVLYETGELAPAGALLDAALAAAAPGADPGAYAELLRRRAEIDRRSGARTAARDNLERARALLPAGNAPEFRRTRAAVHRDLGLVAFLDGDLGHARAHLETALTHTAEGERVLLGTIRNALGVIADTQGDAAGAEAAYEASTAAFEAAGDGRWTSIGYNNLGILAERRGDLDAAETWYRRAVALQAARGDRTGLALSYNNLGVVQLTRGEYDRACAFFEECVRIRTRLGHASLALAHANLAEAHLRRGDLAAAEVLAQRAIDLTAEGRGARYQHAEALRAMAEVQHARGAAAEAERCARAAVAIVTESGDVVRSASARRVLGEVLAAGDRPIEAIAVLETLVDDLDAGRAPLELARSLVVLARLRPGDAAALRARAASLFTAIGARVEAAAVGASNV